MGRSVTLKEKPFDLEGPELQVGSTSPDATLKKNLLEDFKLSEVRGKARVYSVVPSLDTPVCAEQTRRFSKELTAFPNVSFFTVSCDLPVAMNRFCGAEGIDTAKFAPLSDHKDVSFGKAFGTLIPALRIECRAVFVVGADDKLRYVEYVPAIGSHPNYEAVLSCLRKM
jgi:thiol peroxidase